MLSLKFAERFHLNRTSLAIFRIGLGLLILVDLVLRARWFRAHYTNDGIFPIFERAFRFSLHSVEGIVAPSILFCAAIIFAIGLTMGIRPRLCAVFSWVLNTSLQMRCEVLLNGGDNLLRLLLFLAIFLPLGSGLPFGKRSTSSLDAWSNLASSAFVLQLVCVYFFSGWLKLSYPAWRDGMGVQHAFFTDAHITPLGYGLRDFIPVIVYSILNYGVLVVEIGLPLFLLVFFHRTRVRIAICVTFVFFHGFIGVFWSVGAFSPCAIVAWTALLPREFWTRILGSVRSSTINNPWPINASIRILSSGVLVAFMAFILCWNWSTIPGHRNPFWQPLARWGFFLGWDQNWGMFSESATEHAWLTFPAQLSDGSLVDLLTQDSFNAEYEPTPVSRAYASERWRKLFLRVQSPGTENLRLNLGRFLCREWDKEHPEGPGVRIFQINLRQRLLSHDNLQPGRFVFVGSPTQSLLWEHECREGELARYRDEFRRALEARSLNRMTQS